jgi:3'(2'), 5'-bisphosphate nucleotidase
MPQLDAVTCAQLIEPLTALAVRAARAIRQATRDGAVRRKADGSPVTDADLAAEMTIRQGLTDIAPALPVISEEQAEPRATTSGESYFLVDPLDGTREFIAGRDEYTINIALMASGAPILGLIAAPALGLLWRGIVGSGAERMVLSLDGANLPPSAIHGRHRPESGTVVMVSRSHLDTRTRAYLDGLPQSRTEATGSAVKFCRLAEGSADLYPRLGPTHDWDVAAGHAIVAAAGGRVVTPEGGLIRYGTPELLIPGFIASGDATMP